MVKNCSIYNPYPNQAVAEVYVSVIEKALKGIGYETRYIDKIEQVQRDDTVIVVAVGDVQKVKKRKPQKIILWCQGIIPEESYMYHKSILRYKVLSYIEKKAIKNSDFLLLVSEEMKKHYEEKYHIKMDNSYIMPCFNSYLSEEAFYCKEKYKENTFIYAGGMQNWQCVEPMLKLYAGLEKKLENSKMLLYTAEKEQALQYIEKYQIENYKIDFLTPQELDEELKKVKFGFVLREDIAVNNVATPTKFSSYMANGVIPIFTDCIKGFTQATKDLHYKIALSASGTFEEWEEQIIEWIAKMDILPEQVLEEYKTVFSSYYSELFHVENIMKELKDEENI